MRVLLISGWAESPRIWDDVVALFPSAWVVERIGLFDLLPEVDDSEAAAQLSGGFARCLERFGPFDLICGWSLCGMILLESTLVAAPRVVVAASGCFIADEGSPSRSELRALRREVVRAPRAGVERFLRAVHPNDQRSEREQIAQSLDYCEGREAALLIGLKYLEEVDLRPQLANRAAVSPLLFVYGGMDPFVPTRSVEQTAQLCASAARTLLPTSAHAPMLTDTVAFAAAIIDWATA